MNLHCLKCGERLKGQELAGKLREVCPACGWVHYQQLKVGAGVWVQQNERLLLLLRRQPPFAGAWNLPAGYVEVDEPPARTAEREALEETGLHVQPRELVDAFYFTDDPRGNGLLLVYQCEVVGGHLNLDHENGGWGYFAPEEIPTALAGGGHDQAIRLWQARNG